MMEICEILLVALFVMFIIVPLGAIVIEVEIECTVRGKEVE